MIKKYITGHYNPLSLVSHITYVVCVNFKHDLNWKINHFFWKISVYEGENWLWFHKHVVFCLEIEPIYVTEALGWHLTNHLHTYIMGHYNSSIRPSFWHHSRCNVVCERQIFWESLHGTFIYSQSFCQKSAERKSPMKYFSYLVLMSGLGLEPWLFG